MPRGRPRKNPETALEQMIVDVDDSIIEEIDTEEIPDQSSPEWDAYILSKLTQDEKDIQNGYPKTEGLGRLVRTMGTILQSTPKTVVATSEFAVAEHTLIVELWNGQTVTFGGVADAHANNSDGEYCNFLLAVASTRARGRAYRDFLGIKTVVAEEMSEKAMDSVGITDPQKIAIKKMCKDLGIDLMKFVNKGVQQHSSIDVVSKLSARVMLSELNSYTQHKEDIPENILL